MANMSAQALRSAVINAVTSDAAFRDELTKDADKAIQARFGDQSFKPRVLFEKENELSFLIPQQTDKLAQAIGRSVTEIGDRTPTRGEFEMILVQRAWQDAAFRSELRSNPQATIDTALKSYGGSVPEGATVKVYEEQPGESLVVVPRPLDTAAELSDAELEAVAGGEGAVIIVVGAVVGAVATVIADKIISIEAC